MTMVHVDRIIKGTPMSFGARIGEAWHHGYNCQLSTDSICTHRIN